MDINGHAVLVSSGASGLGTATALALARTGAKLALLDFNIERLIVTHPLEQQE